MLTPLDEPGQDNKLNNGITERCQGIKMGIFRKALLLTVGNWSVPEQEGLVPEGITGNPLKLFGK